MSDWKSTERGAMARRLLHGQDLGVLSSMSSELPGYPFGSVTPYVLAPTGQVVIYVSAIAQHTKNIERDPHACITVLEGGEGKPQAQGRVTLVGDGELVPEVSLARVRERYFAFFPEARAYAGTHDFAFYWLQPRRVRHIAGFGQIFWVEPEDWLVPVPEWAGEEQAIVDHMNQDHHEALLRMAERLGGRAASSVELLACDPEGYHLRADERLLYGTFSGACMSLEAVRAAMVEEARASG